MRFFLSLFTVAFYALPAFAAPIKDNGDAIWATQMVEAASPVKERLHEFNTLLQWMMLGIVIIVATLLLVAIFRFRRNRNPIPSKTAHNVPLEIVWTLIPCLILAVIMWHSFPLMYYMEAAKKPDMTLKVTGYQWYWGYSYPDQEIEEFALNLIPITYRDPKREAEELRNLPTYQRLLSTYDQVSGQPAFVVLPVKKTIRVQITANDVLHAWAVPALGVKKDAVPGRLNETWLRIDKPGIYYGQCSELCGIDHGFMPIEIRAVDESVFNDWVTLMKADAPKAMALIQEATLDMARPQIVAPKLTLAALWHKMTDTARGKF